ncbi:MAG: PilW family protein, partial [Noviherbaspirillum sp.]
MRGRTAGLVMAELLPALTLGMLIALAAIALLLTATSAYRLEEEATRLEETGRYAIESIARAVRQAGYEDYASPWSRRGAAIAGWDAASVGKDGRVEAAGADAVNGSDVLELRFMGSADGVLRNCAGFPVAESDDPGSYAGQSTFF